MVDRRARVTDVRRLRDAWVSAGRLALAVLPLVGAVVVAKVGLSLADAEPIELNPLMSGIVAANVFLLGFLLAGTLSDFKESERLPNDVAGSLESIADECLSAREATAHPAADNCLAHLCRIPLAVREWLEESAPIDRALDEVRGLNACFLELKDATETTFINRLKGEQAAVRKALLRMDAIRTTSFVNAGYVVARLTAWVLVAGLLLTDIGPVGEGAFFVGAITFLLAYMNRLIRDLDNPFEYKDGRRGAADVSLEPLERAYMRLEVAASVTARTLPARQEA